MEKWLPLLSSEPMTLRVLLNLFLIAGSLATVHAQEPDIDRLLKKLPPPEKLVRTQVAPGIRLNDPILQDPLGVEFTKALASKNAARALSVARKLSQHHPKSPLGHFLQGSLALQTGQFKESAAAFREAAALEPKFAQAHLGLGVAEGAQSRFAAALPHLQRATQLDPKMLGGWIYQSICCLRLGRKEEAVSAARRATNASPSSAVAWRLLAIAENAAGHRTAASQAASKANRISPSPAGRTSSAGAALPQTRNALVHFQLGARLLLAGQPKEAVGALERSVALNPKFGPAWRNLAIAYRKLGRDREAKSAIAQADRLMPEVVAAVRRSDKARADRQKKAGTAPNPKTQSHGSR